LTSSAKRAIGISTLWQLSPMIKKPPAIPSPSWVQVYRELTEWAVLFSLVREKDYGTDTIIVWDGLLRSKVFSGTLFAEIRKGIAEGMRMDEAKRLLKIIQLKDEHIRLLNFKIFCRHNWSSFFSSNGLYDTSALELQCFLNI